MPTDNAPLSLNPSQVHYLTNVLRLQPGSTVYACDGKGSEVICNLETKGKNAFLTLRGASEYAPADARCQVHVGQGKAPRNRLDWAVEKMTEAGAASITPLASFATKRVDRFQGESDRWRRITAAATAQCGRMTLPTICDASSLEQWQAWLPANCLLLQLAPAASQSLSTRMAKEDAPRPVAFLVGRTSGLDSKEEEASAKLGFEAVTLGARVLRTETVGTVATAIILAMSGEY
jgi:16S rRNA (uracil1498-N3)-methyltransferase